MFDKRCPEGNTLQSQEHVEIPTYDFDAEALHVLMKVLHCRSKDVQERVTMGMMTNIAAWLTSMGATTP